VGVAYGSDVNKVKDILLKVATTHPKISKQPEPFVRFTDFGDSALIFRVFFWTDESFTVRNIKSDLRFAIYSEFEKNGIQIPFPQQDVYIKEMPNGNKE
jgi:small-conductance mechanosensitive channel